MQSLTKLNNLKLESRLLTQKVQDHKRKTSGRESKPAPPAFISTLRVNCENGAIFLASVLSLTEHARVLIGFCYLSSTLLNVTEFLFVDAHFLRKSRPNLKDMTRSAER